MYFILSSCSSSPVVIINYCSKVIFQLQSFIQNISFFINKSSHTVGSETARRNESILLGMIFEVLLFQHKIAQQKDLKRDTMKYCHHYI